MRGTHARNQDDSRFKAGKLRRYGGFITGYAETFAGALNASRAEIIDLVDGEDSNEPAVETEILINGNRGSDNPGGSTNRISSEDYDREGVDRVFVALTVEQFRSLANEVGAEVAVR